MKCCIKILAVAALFVALAFAGCKGETEIESLTQEQMVSKLNEKSKDIVYEAVLAGKNAESLLAKLTDTQKAALFDKMLTDEKKAEIFGELLTDDKKNGIYNEKLTDEEKAKIFNQILTDKRTANTFLALLTEAEKQAVYNELLTDEKKNEIYNEKLTDAVKAEIFNEIFADKRTNGKVVELLNDEEKSAVFDTLLATKTSRDFIVGILTKTGNETLYAEIKAYLNGNFTQAELVALLNAETKTGIYEEILAGKNAEALLAKLSDTQKAALFDKMLTADKKNAAFEEILAAKREAGKVVELLNETEKASVFDTLLATKTSKDFIVGILTKTGNETLYADIKTYITASLTKEELAALLAATDTTAPAVVQALTATSKDTGIELTWTDPSDADLWGFVVGYYETPASRALVLDSTRHEFVVGKSQNADKSNKTFVGNLTDKKTYVFYIKSVDENFNVSEAKESASCTYNEKFVEVEKKLEAGTYTVYHLQQKTTGGKTVSDYVLESTDSNKFIAAKSTIADLKKTYEGFTEKSMSQNEKAIYIFYDRNTITYTFQITEGKFEDGTTSKEVSGLYGASYKKPIPKRDGYIVAGWKESENAAPYRFGAEDKTWTAVWTNKPDYTACVVGDYILKDGTILSKNSTPESGTVAAVIVRAATEDKPALGVGIVHNRSGLAWCTGSAAGYNTNITALQGDKSSGYMDGSDGWEKLKAACSDAEAHPEYYPAWNYSLTYAATNVLTGALEEGWYLPTVAELYTICQNKTEVEASLSKADGSQFGTSWYWSCCLSPSDINNNALRLYVFNGTMLSNAKHYDGVCVCSVRAFN